MTKAVSNREICFIKAVLLLCEHGHFFFSKFCVAWCKLPSPPPLELPSTKNQSGNRIFWLYDGNDRFNYESLNSDKNIIKVLYTILSLGSTKPQTVSCWFSSFIDCVFYGCWKNKKKLILIYIHINTTFM